MTRKRGRSFVIGAWASALAAVGIAAFLAGRWTFLPPDVEASPRPVATYEVADATIGTSIDGTVKAKWDVATTGVNALTGIVTTIALDGPSEVKSGDVLYTVNLRPVVVAQGEVPAFRDLFRGVSGRDVTQLQRYLIDAGYYAGPLDGDFGSGTEVAVKAWQRALGEERTGVVTAGELLFVPSLPALVVLNEELYVGAQVTVGAQVITVLNATPTFTLSLPVEQASRIPVGGADLTVAGPSGQWRARTGAVEFGDSGLATVEILPAAGDSVCGDACDELEYSGDGVVLSAQVALTPEVTGPAVPLSALGSTASGGVVV